MIYIYYNKYYYFIYYNYLSWWNTDFKHDSLTNIDVSVVVGNTEQSNNSCKFVLTYWTIDGIYLYTLYINVFFFNIYI